MKLCVLAAAAAAALLVMGLALSAGIDRSADIAIGAQQSETPPAVTAERQGGYIIRSHNGKIALFTNDFTTTPTVETDIDVNMLRAYDRQLLERGIEVSTYEEVLRLLEDFVS